MVVTAATPLSSAALPYLSVVCPNFYFTSRVERFEFENNNRYSPKYNPNWNISPILQLLPFRFVCNPVVVECRQLLPSLPERIQNSCTAFNRPINDTVINPNKESNNDISKIKAIDTWISHVDYYRSTFDTKWNQTKRGLISRSAVGASESELSWKTPVNVSILVFHRNLWCLSIFNISNKYSLDYR